MTAIYSKAILVVNGQFDVKSLLFFATDSLSLFKPIITPGSTAKVDLNLSELTVILSDFLKPLNMMRVETFEMIWDLCKEPL